MPAFAKLDDVTKLMMKDIASTKPLTREEELTLFKKYNESDISSNEKDKIRFKLVTSNMRFVLKIALHYTRVIGADLSELVGEGKIGLYMAVDKFDYKKGNKFISFAVWWIRCYISKYLDQNDLIRLPSHQKLRLNRIRKEDPYMLSDDDRYLLELTHGAVAIDSSIGSPDDDLTLKDIIKDETIQNGEQVWTQNQVNTELLEIIERVLTTEEQIIIKGLFGFNDGEDNTLNDVHTIIGKSKERIRQIRNRALDKLRTNVDVRDLNEILHKVNG